MAERASNCEELMRVVNMMGDTNVETARRNYLNFQYEEDDEHRRMGAAAARPERQRASRHSWGSRLT